MSPPFPQRTITRSRRVKRNKIKRATDEPLVVFAGPLRIRPRSTVGLFNQVIRERPGPVRAYKTETPELSESSPGFFDVFRAPFRGRLAPFGSANGALASALLSPTRRSGVGLVLFARRLELLGRLDCRFRSRAAFPLSTSEPDGARKHCQ